MNTGKSSEITQAIYSPLILHGHLILDIRFEGLNKRHFFLLIILYKPIKI